MVLCSQKGFEPKLKKSKVRKIDYETKKEINLQNKKG